MNTGRLLSGGEWSSHTTPRNLPASRWIRLLKLLSRAIRLRCPLCGSADIFRHPWAMKHHCPSCAYRFEREDGYFLGAYALNLVVAEVIGLGAVLVFLFRSDLSLLGQEAIAVAAAVALPLLLYPWSRTFWMMIDLEMFQDSEQEAGSGDGNPLPAENGPGKER